MEFFDAVERANEIILFSRFVLKELSFVMHPEEFEKKKEVFKDDTRFERILYLLYGLAGILIQNTRKQ